VLDVAAALIGFIYEHYCHNQGWWVSRNLW